MKSVPEALTTELRNAVNVEARPVLVAEWNMNRYFSPTASNSLSEDTEGYDIEIFPIESICEVPRPSKGISRARTDEAMTFSGEPLRNRYYTANADNVYKYWTSPYPTNSSGNFTGTVPAPRVVYSEPVSVNKIVIGLDNYWASPNSFTVKIQTTANGAWTTVATSPTIQNNGQIVLWYNGTAWSTNQPNLSSPPLLTITGVMLEVSSMGPGKKLDGSTTNYVVSTPTNVTSVNTTGANSYLNVIEISARREQDITEYLISVEDSFEMSEISDLYPIGTLTANTATLQLSNIALSSGNWSHGAFNPNNTTGPFYKLIQPNIQFTLDYVYTIGGVDYPVRQFVMYGEEPVGVMANEVTLSLRDASKFLEEKYPEQMLQENLTVPQLMGLIMDSVGFTNYQIDDSDLLTKHIIPMFWTDGEKSAWQVLDELARASQSAIYFDHNGVLQVKTRDAAFNKSEPLVWTLRGENSGLELADIIELEQNDEAGANKLSISYQAAAWDGKDSPVPVTQKVWEPEDTVVLRATPIARDMSSSELTIWISRDQAKLWPYEGIMQVEGELIKYRGKEFRYIDAAGTPQTVIVNSQDDYKEYNEKGPANRRKENYFTGKFIIQQRGYWNSNARAHVINNTYNVRRQDASSPNSKVGTGGAVKDNSRSTLVITSVNNAAKNDLTIATVPTPLVTGYKIYGTRIRFPKSERKHQRAGIVIHNNGSQENGYYVELQVSKKLTDAERDSRGSLVFYRSSSNSIKQYGKGASVTIIDDKFYDLDVYYRTSGSNQIFTVYLNGRKHLNITVPGSETFAETGKFGMFVRGDSKAEFEYLYAVNREYIAPPDQSEFFDLVEGGFNSGFWDREMVYGALTNPGKRKKKNSTKNKQRWSNYYFDEFGPIVHELREFDVKFDPAPVKFARPFLSNTWASVMPEFSSGPFGAKFLLCNSARKNVVVNGEDNESFGNQPVNQILAVLGNVIVFSESEELSVSNEQSIRRNGIIESELSSDWIQTKEMAQDVLDWMNAHWGTGADTLTVNVFGNPLFELTDIVAVDYPERFMSPSTHKYFVVAVNTSFTSGIETKLTLRRVT